VAAAESGLQYTVVTDEVRSAIGLTLLATSPTSKDRRGGVNDEVSPSLRRMTPALEGQAADAAPTAAAVGAGVALTVTLCPALMTSAWPLAASTA